MIGLESSGPHSNGYSLVRKIVATKGGDYDELFDGKRKLGDALIEPTRIYVKPVLHLLTQVAVKGIAHITGGGLVENIPRVLPEGLCARIERAQLEAARRSSTGCSATATWTTPRWRARSTAASAWW